MTSMKIEDFNYQLPNELIAQYPPKYRGDSKLLTVNPNTGQLKDMSFREFVKLLNPNDLIIFNNTKVIKARLFGKKETGGKIEILIERVLSDQTALALIKSSKKISNNLKIILPYNIIQITKREGNLFLIELNAGSFYDLMEENGHVPLPPYINRPDQITDIERYQTVFAETSGAVAAPTAGLHFSQDDFNNLKKLNIDFDFITLHVGSGTFQPVKVEKINTHIMHDEYFHINEDVKNKIEKTKNNGGRIIAIGTTVLRALEAASMQDTIITGHQKTNIFITPGYNFKTVDALFTNFHLPKSTLLMLVSAFAGFKFTKIIYNHAIKQQYRFFSYGDAMFIEQKNKNKEQAHL